jgi:hypothetical protein
MATIGWTAFEQILEELALSQRQFQEQVARSHQDLAARQQYHDEAFERHDAEMKRHDAEMRVIREAIAADAENIRALERVAKFPNRRSDHLDGEEPA